jgi:hypothetical protein
MIAVPWRWPHLPRARIRARVVVCVGIVDDAQCMPWVHASVDERNVGPAHATAPVSGVTPCDLGKSRDAVRVLPSRTHMKNQNNVKSLR